MTRFKIAIALLAIVFTVGSSFATKNKTILSNELAYFTYDEELLGNKTCPSSWIFEGFEIPEDPCAASSGVPCYIRVHIVGTSHVANDDNLRTIAIIVPEFDEPASPGDLQLRIKTE